MYILIVSIDHTDLRLVFDLGILRGYSGAIHTHDVLSPAYLSALLYLSEVFWSFYKLNFFP